MRTPQALLGTIFISTLASTALGNHVCLPSGCYPAMGKSMPATTEEAPSCDGATIQVARSEGLLSAVVTFFRDIVGKVIPGRGTAGGPAATLPSQSQLGRPTEAVKKKASRMELSKPKKYMKSLGRT